MQSAPDHPAGQVRWPRAPTRPDWVGGSVAAARIRGEIATAALSADPVVIVAEPGSGRRLVAELIHRSSRAGRPNPAEGFLPLRGGNMSAEKLVPHLEMLAAGARGNGNGSGPPTLYLSGIERAALSDIAPLAAISGIRLIASTTTVATTRASGRREAPPTTAIPGATTIRIPPLRERRMDISPLALRFLTDSCERCDVGPYGISSRTIVTYHDYEWPGNAAELRAMIESAVATAALARFRGQVLPDSFCAICFDGDRTGRSLKATMLNLEKSILQNTLDRVGGNQTHAARRLQLSTTTLHEKLKRHGLLQTARTRPNQAVR